MKTRLALSAIATSLLLSGCATFSRPSAQPPSPIPCTYRFKSLSRPEDQARVEAAIHAVAYGNVTKGGTVSYPEYRFRVAKLADLDALTPSLLYVDAERTGSPFMRRAPHKQTLNLRACSVDFTFDSTDVTASATTIVTFNIRPGSRLYFKNPGGVESDITAKIDKSGRVSLPVHVKDGQKYLYVRAMKDSVTRYIRINIFTNQTQDISKREY